MVYLFDDQNQCYSAYGAIINGKAVCQGYASLFYRMCREAGIPARIITGLGNGGAHAWNIVKLDGAYYNVDVTWDDTEDSNYNYFNKSDSEYASTHRRTGLSVYLPACEGGGRNGAGGKKEGYGTA